MKTIRDISKELGVEILSIKRISVLRNKGFLVILKNKSVEVFSGHSREDVIKLLS